MQFTKLKLDYFGRFHNKEIELKSGINIIYGENEAGKSTIHTFIKGMLFGIERLRGRGSSSKEDQYTRYLPWEYPGAFGGSMDLWIDGKEYRLKRSFHANDKSFKVVELSTGREVVLKEGRMSEIIPGLTESTYRNTVSIEQLKAPTDGELASQVRNYITNLSIAKSKEVDVPKAIRMLNDQRKQLEGGGHSTVLKNLKEEIEDGIIKEEQMDKLIEQQRILLKEEQEIEEQRMKEQKQYDEVMTDMMEQLPAILEKYRVHQELTHQEKVLEEEEKLLGEKLRVLERERGQLEGMLADMEMLQKLQKQGQTNEIQLQEVLEELDENRGHFNRLGLLRRLFFLGPAILISILILIALALKPIGFVLSVILLTISVIGDRITEKRHGSGESEGEERYRLLHKHQEQIQEEIRHIMSRNKISGFEEIGKKQEEAIRNSYVIENTKEQSKEVKRRRTHLEDQRDSLYDIIMKYMQYFTKEDELTPSSIQRLQDVVYQKRRMSHDKQEGLNQRREVCRLSLEKLRWEIALLEGNEEQLLKNKEYYMELEQKQKDKGVELEAIKLALHSIEELSSEIHDSFGHRLNDAVSEVMSEVTGQKYTDIKVDEKLDIKVGWNREYIQLDRLSAGTIDQVYFALRLAVAHLLLDREEMPILLDDSFALYDDNRVRAVINKLMKREQVILFTCHNRERELMEEMGIEYHFVDLSCS